MEGWIKLHRSLLNHWIWQDEKYFRWWITILLYVNHSETKFPLNGQLISCNPGESYISIDRWTYLFKCSKPTVFKFFEQLENDGMIHRKIVGRGNRRKHLLIVANWGKFQQMETENFTRTKPETLPKQNPNVPPNKNDKNEKELFIDDFNTFWDLYGKKVQRQLALKYWEKLSKSDKAKIFETLPKYLQSTPDLQYRVHPAKYLRDRRFEDEIPVNSIQPSNNGQPKILTSKPMPR